MDNRIVIGDGRTFRMLYNNLPIYEGWASTLTMTSQLARTIDGDGIAKLGIEINNKYEDNDVAMFQNEHRQEFSTTLAEASSLYYSYMSGTTLLTENKILKNLAKQLGCESCDIKQFVRIMIDYELLKLDKMTG